ncbi:unnamed protein product [Moneuplotes crassus]|uniref:Uncharacterized protein n=1 Tax=Euplotes crassus TaxID=5936 RepID=A0AAD1UQ81_EUPCR|nr:unnamed protein product [Moneuplotes crassus]
MEFKAKIFRSYSSQEILEQFNILKKIINKCSIPNMRKEGRRGLESNKENFARDSWGSIGDDVHPSPTLKRTKTQKERLIKTHFQTIFYIPEFLDTTSELQNKEVFQELIYANTHECSSISKFTKAGRHRSNLLEKDSLKINLELLREQYHTKVPSLQDLKLLEVTRNYECLARFCERN